MTSEQLGKTWKPKLRKHTLEAEAGGFLWVQDQPCSQSCSRTSELLHREPFSWRIKIPLPRKKQRNLESVHCLVGKHEAWLPCPCMTNRNGDMCLESHHRQGSHLLITGSRCQVTLHRKKKSVSEEQTLRFPCGFHMHIHQMNVCVHTDTSASVYVWEETDTHTHTHRERERERERIKRSIKLLWTDWCVSTYFDFWFFETGLAAHSAVQWRPYVSLMVTSNIYLFSLLPSTDITGIGLPLHLSSATNLYQIL